MFKGRRSQTAFIWLLHLRGTAQAPFFSFTFYCPIFNGDFGFWKGDLQLCFWYGNIILFDIQN